MADRTMRVTIVEPNPLVAEAVRVALIGEGFLVRKIDVLHSEPTATDDLLATTRGKALRLFLLGRRLGPFGDALGLIGPLTKAGAAVIHLAAGDDPDEREEALRRGAREVIAGTCGVPDVVAAARNVLHQVSMATVGDRRGERVTGRRASPDLLDLRMRLERLTPSEGDVLSALMQGLQVREIARTRVVSESTVRTQVKNILSKMEMSSQVAVVSAAYRTGWAPSGTLGPVQLRRSS